MKRNDRSIDFIMRINKFADDCEAGIQMMNARYRQAKADVEGNCVAQLKSAIAWQKRAAQQLDSKCNDISSGVGSLLRELDKLDALIARVDKYYQKTKVKAADSSELPSLNTSDDYVEALKQIVDRFKVVSAKYTEKVLPFLINDINYLLSKRRKQDYAELLSLQRLALRLNEEIKENLKTVRDEELSAIEEKAAREQDSIQQKRNAALETIEMAYKQNIEQAAGVMCLKLEELVPDSEIGYLQTAKARALAQLKRINTVSNAFPKKLMLYTYLFPLREYVSLPMIQQLLASKCASLALQDDVLVVPAEYELTKPVNIILKEDKRSETSLKSIQQTVYSYLSAMPVSKLKLAVIDPEHHGNSIAPFFELQRVEPDLLYQNIAVTQEDISKLISNLSDYVDEILRYRLVGEDDTIFDNPEDAECILLLI